MYRKVDLKEISHDLDNFKLCFIGPIEETVFDYTPESKAFMQTEEFKKQKEEHDRKFKEELEKTGRYVFKDDDYFKSLKMEQYPNPDFIPGVATHFAYYTSIPIEEQWGDDWNDSTYECNAGIPYDKTEVEHEIVTIPIYVDGERIKEPKDWTFNSPFSVDDINKGAIPWLFFPDLRAYLMAGSNPLELVEVLSKIKE